MRIQMRGNVLNKQGTYNRCKLTRLVVDEEWEQRVWKESWEPRLVKVDEEGIQAEGSKSRRRGEENDNKKRRKMDSEGTIAWGGDSASYSGEQGQVPVQPSQQGPESRCHETDCDQTSHRNRADN